MSQSTRQLAHTMLDGKLSILHRRVALSRAITLMESKHPDKKQQADHLLTYLLQESSNKVNNSNSNSTKNARTAEDTATTDTMHNSNRNNKDDILRIGFAGPPGVGKSNLIEAFGMYLLKEERNCADRQLAVVCIDPASGISGGSILGDKTRMTELSRQERAYVRPSSNGAELGGLAAYTDDVVTTLTAAGYPLVLVETVGLGQSEVEVAQSVDVLVLLLAPGGGDDLQGVKKGIVELANVLVVTKADGNLEAAAKRTASDYQGAINVLHQINNRAARDSIWKPPVLLTSAISKKGMDALWDNIVQFRNHSLATGDFERRRNAQSQYWMWRQFTRMMQARISDDPQLKDKAQSLSLAVSEGSLTPRVSAQKLLDVVFSAKRI